MNKEIVKYIVCFMFTLPALYMICAGLFNATFSPNQVSSATLLALGGFLAAVLIYIKSDITS